jgi:hypothetical protein
MPAALPLITEEDGQYVVCPEAVEMLETLAAPIAVVSIAGLWRTGKSYLLNHLTGANVKTDGTGFNVGATVNACTKGLWLWGEPVTLADGLTVLFVDTEGLGSTSRTQTEDSQIFSLALLLSSLFVWNSRGVIDGNALEDFALVVNLTKHIHVRSNAADKAITAADARAGAGNEKKTFVAGGGSSGGSGGSGGGAGHELDELSEHFPAFMWVVRDFTLRLEDGGRKITDRQYLENALKPQQSFTSEAASRTPRGFPSAPLSLSRSESAHSRTGGHLCTKVSRSGTVATEAPGRAGRRRRRGTRSGRCSPRSSASATAARWCAPPRTRRRCGI